MSLSALAICAVSGQAVARERQIHFALESQPLGIALVAFAVRADVSIATPPEGFGDARARAVRGSLAPDAALRELLAGTGYGFVRIDPATFRIQRQTEALAQPPPPAQGSEVIVVTARRRPEVLDRVPASATVVNPTQLDDLGVRSTEDMAMVASGLTYTNLGAGRDKIFVRGLSDGAFSGRTASTVGIYLDDSRVTYSAPNPDLLLVDVDRVEVLRGPQGALYGGGAIGGLVHVVTNEPDLGAFGGSLSGDLAVTQGGDVGSRISGVVNAPIVEGRVGLRAVGYRDVDSGWLNNSILNARNTNRTTTQGMRLTMAADLDAAWTISARALYQNIDANDSQYIKADSGDTSRAANVLEPYGVDFTLGSVTADGPTPLGRLTSSTSIVRHSFSSRFDATAAFAALRAGADDITVFDTANELKFVIEEAQLVGVAAPFPWTLGVFASYGREQSEDVVFLDSEQGVQPSLYANTRHDSIMEYALYGNVAWPLAAGWTLDVGARLFHSEIRVRAEAVSVDRALEDRFSGAHAESGITPDLQISYEPSAGSFYYARLSEGYRGGGYNTGAAVLLDATAAPSVQPGRQYGRDRLWSGEIGVKRAFLDGAARVRAAAFWQYWDNIQTDQLFAESLPFTGNVGDGENRGVELEGAFDIRSDVSVSAHVSYSLPEIVNADPSFPVSSDAALPGAPKLVAGGTLVVRHDFGGWGQGTAALDGLYVGRSDITFIDSTSADIGGYFTADVRFALRRDDWNIAFYLNNLSNNEASTFSYGNPFNLGNPGLVTPLRPRTFGVELARAF